MLVGVLAGIQWINELHNLSPCICVFVKVCVSVCVCVCVIICLCVIVCGGVSDCLVVCVWV